MPDDDEFRPRWRMTKSKHFSCLLTVSGCRFSGVVVGEKIDWITVITCGLRFFGGHQDFLYINRLVRKTIVNQNKRVADTDETTLLRRMGLADVV